MRRVRFLHRHVRILGASFPLAPFALASAIVAVTLIGAMGYRNGLRGPLALGILSPSAIFERGEVWRLLSWSFFEMQPLNLVFVTLVLLFFGRDLSNNWGPERFLLRCAGLIVSTSLLTCLVVRFAWTSAYDTWWASAWPLGEAVMIAWATQFPSARILMYFVLPIGGRQFVILTVASTFVFAALSGFDLYLPHFVAEGLTLAWLYAPTPRELWWRLRARRVRFTPQRPSYIRPVEKPSEPKQWLH